MTRTLPTAEPGPLSSIAYRKRSPIRSDEWEDLVQFGHFLYRRSGTRLAQYVYEPAFRRPDTSVDSTYSQEDTSGGPRSLSAIEPAARFRRLLDSSGTAVVELELVVYGFDADVRCTPHRRVDDSDTALPSFNVTVGSGWGRAFQTYDYLNDIQSSTVDNSNIYMELDARSTSSSNPAEIYQIEVRASVISSSNLLRGAADNTGIPS
jgi:hypothetical protein